MARIDTIAALLAKAERTDNDEEAAAYLAKAQHLATLSSIDLAAAAASASTRSEQMITRIIEVGPARRHVNVHLIELFSAIASANDVVIDIASNNTCLYAYGTETDVDTCESLWMAAAPHMVEGMRKWIRSGKWKPAPGTWVARTVTARNAKAAWADGYTSRIRTRLAAARTDAITEHDTGTAASSSSSSGGGAELVLVAKKERVRDWYAKTSRARGSWNGYSGRRHSPASARAGAAAANTAPLARGGELTQRPRIGGR